MKKILLRTCSTSFWGSIALIIIFVLALHPQAYSQATKVITGTVVEADGSLMPGVTLTVKGTNRKAVTNTEGKFSIQASSNDMLVFSFIGFVTKEVSVGQQTRLTVTLQQSTSTLNDVVFVGYVSKKKSDLTGSVGQLNISDVSKAPVGSFAEALAGRLAGVQVSSVDGQPGAGINIQIRGPGSLTQSTSPLYVIDGFPVENLDPTTLNPEEIESLTVLKDASSTAIYGSRAANGVIVIQTKRGKVGKAQVSASAQVGFQSTPKKIDLMSPYEFVKYQQELTTNIGTPASTIGPTSAFFANGKTLEDYRNVQGIDMQDYLFKTGVAQIYNIALRGGTEQTRYSVSGSDYDLNGAIINTGLNRYSGRATIDQTISKKIKTGITINYSGVKTKGQVVNQAQVAANNPTSYLLATAWMYRPISPYPNDDLLNDVYDNDATTTSDIRINPLISQQNQYQVSKTNLVEANGYISYDITKHLTLRSAAGIRHNLANSEVLYNSKTAQGSPYNAANTNGVWGAVRNTTTSAFNNSNTLNFKTSINKAHNISALALFEINTINTSSNGYGGRLLPNENLGINGLEEGVAYNAVFAKSKNTLASYAGRLDYDYKSRYVLSATFRADGSSKFVNNKWGYFPSFGLAWNIQNEEFFKKAFPVISTSKIRANYGTSGNNRIGDFDGYPSLRVDPNTNGYSFGNGTPTSGVYVNNVGNPDLKWETVKTIDFGYELGLLQDRITLEVDAYRRTTDNLLLNADLPPTTGFGSAVKNIGKLQNQGLEFTLNTVNIANKSFRWQSNFNISFNQNKILALTRGQVSLQSNVAYVSQFGQPLYLAEIGKPAGMMIGYIWEGNYQYSDFDNPSPGVYILKPDVAGNGATRSTILPGDIKYKDLNGDGTITQADQTFIGRGQPIHTGGFTNNFTYKGFDLNVFFQWSYGNNIYNANRLLLEGNSNRYLNINQYASYENRWTPDNQTNENYRAGGQGPIGLFSSRVVEDGSYLRLKTVSLGYNIPANLLKRYYLTGLNLSVSAQNLLTFTNYSGLDPEVSTRSAVSGGVNGSVLTPGYDFSAYPKSPTVVFGIKATF